MFPSKARYLAEVPLELVHGDLCGPVSLAIPGGRPYFLFLVDDYNRLWFELLSYKGDARAAIRNIQAAAEDKCGRRLPVLRTDNGGEFTSTQFACHCEEQGMERQERSCGEAESNGARYGSSTVETEKMSARYWGDTVCIAVSLTAPRRGASLA